MKEKHISILGATGTIGQTVLDIIHEQNYIVDSIAVGENIELLIKQIEKFSPKLISVKNRKDCNLLKDRYPNIEIYWGDEGLKKVATYKKSDIIISAIVGFAGFIPTYYALKEGKRVAIANKESIVAGFKFLSPLLSYKNQILPLDSEHVAIFQMIENKTEQDIEKIILTASGGPFWDIDSEDFKNIDIDSALNHPNWSMGKKITIDSSTMVNKTLEIIEASYLFSVPFNKIDISIHPQSIVHSLVKFKDGSILAQLSPPDMKIPISYILSHPKHIKQKAPEIDFSNFFNLNFYPPNYEKFPSLKFAKNVLDNGDLGVVLNSSNEIAVEYFLSSSISWLDIYKIINYVMKKFPKFTLKTPKDLLIIDNQVRDFTKMVIEKGLQNIFV